MNYTNPQIQRLARRIPYLCAAYFVVFAFCYLWLFQIDLLAQVHYSYSEAQAYHPLLAALLSTFLLLVVGIFASRHLRWLPLRTSAATWFLPFLLLGLLTHWRMPQFGDIGSATGWPAYVVLLIIYIIFLLLARTINDSSKEHESLPTYLWPNLLILVLLSLMTVWLGNTDQRLHRTLRSATLADQGRYTEVLEIARHEHHPTRQLTALTALSLSQTQQLGESLFHYPQPYGSDGLLPVEADTALFVNLPHLVGRHLGYQKTDRTPTELFLSVITNGPRRRPQQHDYELCALLLSRDLEAFVRRVVQSDTLPASLPSHYREALVLRQQLDTLAQPQLADSLLTLRYQQFDSLRHLPVSESLRALRCRQQFGNTYWAYYFYKE